MSIDLIHLLQVSFGQLYICWLTYTQTHKHIPLKSEIYKVKLCFTQYNFLNIIFFFKTFPLKLLSTDKLDFRSWTGMYLSLVLWNTISPLMFIVPHNTTCLKTTNSCFSFELSLKNQVPNKIQKTITAKRKRKRNVKCYLRIDIIA